MFKYPDFHNHKKEHDAFIFKVAKVQEDFQSGKLTFSVEISKFLKDWFSNHIMGTDKQYSSLFNEKGLS